MREHVREVAQSLGLHATSFGLRVDMKLHEPQGELQWQEWIRRFALDFDIRVYLLVLSDKFEVTYKERGVVIFKKTCELEDLHHVIFDMMVTQKVQNA